MIIQKRFQNFLSKFSLKKILFYDFFNNYIFQIITRK